MAKGQDNYRVEPVAKSLQVLSFVGGRRRSVSLAEVSRALNLPKTTAFRYLKTMVQADYLRHDAASGTYYLGEQLRNIVRADLAVQALMKVAQPVMRSLFSEFNETVNLATKDGPDVVYVDQLVPWRSLKSLAHIGSADPLHSTALGKAILAAVPPSERASYFAMPLAERTGRTLVERAEVERQLAGYRKAGYAVEAGENEDGLMCIGAAILDEDGYPFAALSISAPLHRMPSTLRAKIGARLREASEAISRHGATG